MSKVPTTKMPTTKMYEWMDRIDERLSDERGMTNLEKIGMIAIIVSALSFIPVVRTWIAQAYDSVFRQIDGNTGEVSAFSIAMRGIMITIVAIVSFIGTGFMLLYTNLGKRLAFLVTGAATFGWSIVGSMLFVVYAPRGLAPANLDGLNSFQVRIPAIMITLASAILFLMFVTALDRYEKESEG